MIFLAHVVLSGVQSEYPKKAAKFISQFFLAINAQVKREGASSVFRELSAITPYTFVNVRHAFCRERRKQSSPSFSSMKVHGNRLLSKEEESMLVAYLLTRSEVGSAGQLTAAVEFVEGLQSKSNVAKSTVQTILDRHPGLL